MVKYALKGYMAIGQKDIVYNTIQLLDSMSTVTNGNGRIIHEMSTNGPVFKYILNQSSIDSLNHWSIKINLN